MYRTLSLLLSGFIRYKCAEEILTITAMLSVNNAIFYRPKVSGLLTTIKYVLLFCVPLLTSYVACFAFFLYRTRLCLQIRLGKTFSDLEEII